MSEKLAPGPWPDEHHVAAIVVNYRTAQLAIDCVESLLKSAGVQPRIILVDNASGDDSVERLRTAFGDHPSVVVQARSINDGYAGGNNAGVACAREMDARYAFILNSDTIVDKDCVRLLVNEADGDASVALVAPRVFFGDAPDRLWFGGGRFSLWRGRPIHVGFRKTAEHGWTTRRDLDFASGCALLVRLSALDAAEMFDASLFSYAEDLDLSLRLRERGHRLRYVPEAKIWHFEGSSHRRAGGQALRFYLTTRNLLRVDARHARWYHWLTLGPMLAIDVVARFCVVALRDGEVSTLAAVLRGCWHALSGGRHAIERDRRA